MKKESISYCSGDSELLPQIEALWVLLNEQHREKSMYFAEAYERMSFNNRIQKLYNKSEKAQIHVVLAKHKEAVIGYCVSTIDGEGTGEIDSIYVLGDFRKSGVGEGLMKESLAWLDRHDIRNKKLIVSYGNDEVLEFYKKFGFYPKSITLFLKEE